jgi:hypothetical protein
MASWASGSVLGCRPAGWPVAPSHAHRAAAGPWAYIVVYQVLVEDAVIEAARVAVEWQHLQVNTVVPQIPRLCLDAGLGTRQGSHRLPVSGRKRVADAWLS